MDFEGEGSGGSTHHLLGNYEYGLGCELLVTVVEQVLPTRIGQVDDQHAVQAFLAKVIDVRDSGRFMSVDFLRRSESRLSVQHHRHRHRRPREHWG